MKAADIEELLAILGCSRITFRSAWVNSTCPFARWSHAAGRDTHPSFGVSVYPGGTSRTQCFGCGYRGDLRSLLWRLRARKGDGRWFARAAKVVMRESLSLEQLEALVEYKETGSFHKRLERAQYARYEPPTKPVGVRTALSLEGLQYPILPEADLLPMADPIPDFVMDYLTGSKRRLTPETAAMWELGWHPGARRISIPVRDWNGALVGVSGRSLDNLDPLTGRWKTEQEPKFLHSTGFARNLFLFGEHAVKERGGVGCLVEGQFDVIRLSQMGVPGPVACLGTHLSPVQIEKLVALFSYVVLFPDGDEPGKEAAVRWAYDLKGRVATRLLDTPLDGRDPDEYELADLREFGVVDNRGST